MAHSAHMPGGRGHFDTTRWTLVLAAGSDDPSAARRAFSALCETYWYPLYAYVRRQGYDAEDARDLTQSFFVSLLERNDVQMLRRERGRFRSFLLASHRHFFLNDLAHKRREKRAGGQAPLALHFADS
jgi:DNA-directed RNA polymerase specialized sigma24 family protein